MGAQDKKFKVGDRVRRVEPSDWPEQYGEVGKEYTVLEVSRGGSIVVIAGESAASANAFELVEAKWEPKVGDRVLTEGRGWTDGMHVGVIVKHTNGFLVEFDDDFEVGHDGDIGDDKSNRWWFTLAELKPFTIETGKFYKTRDGRKVGPMKVHDGIAEARGDFGWVCVYTDTLRANLSGEHRDDIIAEWVDEPAVANDNAAPAKFRVGDRVRGKNMVGIDVDGIITRVDHSDHELPYHIDGGGWCRDGDVELVNAVRARVNPAIVCLIENGQPKPATRPYVHATESEATKEAERLALKHPGQQFGVYVLAGSKIADEVITKTAVLRAA